MTTATPVRHEAPTLSGVTAMRFLVAEILGTCDALCIEPKGVAVDLYFDSTPSAVQVWCRTYDDMQTLAERYGVGDVVHFNGTPGSNLLHMGRATYDAGCPTIAGVRCGLRLVADRP